MADEHQTSPVTTPSTSMKSFLGIVLVYGANFVAIVWTAHCDLPTVSVTFGSCNISAPHQDGTVYSFGVLLTINQAQLCATPSTFVATPLLEHEDVCSEKNRKNMTAAQCRSLRGNPVRGDAGTASAEGLGEQNPNMKFLPTIDKAIQTPLQLPAGTAVAVRSLLITSGDQHANSHLPLNEQSVVLAKLKSDNHIAANSSSLDSGSQRFGSSRNGRLTFGGYEPARFKGPQWLFKINRTELEINNRSCPLQVDLRQINITIGDAELELVSPDQNTRVCIEIYDRLTRLPSLGLNTLRSALRARGAEELIQEQGEPKGRFHGTLDPEPGLLYGPGSSNISLTTLVRSMQITLGGGLVGGSPTDLTVNLDTEDLVQPLIGLNANGAPAVNTSLRKLMVYHERGIGDAAVLGRGVLEKLYLYVDYDNDVFHLGYIDPESRYQAPVSSKSCSGDTKPVDYLAWQIVQSVVLAIAIAVIVGLGWYILRTLAKHNRTLANQGSTLANQELLLRGLRDAEQDIRRLLAPLIAEHAERGEFGRPLNVID